MTTIRYFDREIETLDREGLRQHQWERFQVLAHRIWPTNQFYRRKWLGAGIDSPLALKSWDDFRRLPFTKKHELVLDQEVHPPFGTNHTFPLSAYTRLHQTSGTTGKPLRCLDTHEVWDWWSRLWSFVLCGAGVTPADRLFMAFSFGPFVGFWSAYAGGRRMGCLIITAGGQDTRTRLEAVRRTQPTVFVSTPSYALHFAEAAAEMGFDLPNFTVHTTIHAGEPGANIPATKSRIEAAFGARCFDHCGMTEVGATGFSCVAETGTHLIESEFIVEVLDPETGEPVPEGQPGELVLTNLGRTGFPLIRYRTGDQVTLTTERCECHRTFARMPGGIIGRVDDMICVRGINIFPSAIESVVRNYDQVVEFRIEVFKVKGMDELRIVAEPAPELNESQVTDTVRNLADDLRARLGLRVDVVPTQPGTLPRYEMKAKRMVRLEQPPA